MKLKPEMVRELVRYEPDTGKFFYRKRPERYFKNATDAFMWNHKNEDKEFLVPNPRYGEYVSATLLGEEVLAHRLAWFLTHGEWPDKTIDHINGVKYDNRICNLRLCHGSENQRNMVKNRTNTSGESNVLATEHGTFAVLVAGNRVGTFKTMAEAVEARDAYFKANGFTGRHGKDRIVETRKPPYRIMKKFRKNELRRERQAAQ